MEDLRNLTRIVVIGWRGADDALLGQLALNPTKQIPALFALGSEQEGRAAVDRFGAAGVSLAAEVYNGGFSQLVVGRVVEQFLAGR